jgi:predicted transcriptional regulator
MGSRQMSDGSAEEESEQDHSDEPVPLTYAVLVDENRELQRNAAMEKLQEAMRQLQEERDELSQRLRNMTVAESVRALPTGNEEEVATEATHSSSLNKCIMIAYCVWMILVVAFLVVAGLLKQH